MTNVGVSYVDTTVSLVDTTPIPRFKVRPRVARRKDSTRVGSEQRVDPESSRCLEMSELSERGFFADGITYLRLCSYTIVAHLLSPAPHVLSRLVVR